MQSESLRAFDQGAHVNNPLRDLIFPVAIFTVTRPGSPKLVLDSLKASRKVGDLSMGLLQGPPTIFWLLKE